VRTSLFIGSSTEGLEVARALQLELDRDAEVEIWSQGVFGLSEGSLSSLVAAVNRFDFAVLVLTADDLTVSRGVEHQAPRDNVLFELGLFMGGLGVDRTFIVFDRSGPPWLPSDLAGVTSATYEPHSTGNLQAALGAGASLIRRTMESLGPRPDRAGRALKEATDSLDAATLRAAEISKLMARSRITELEITVKTFAPVLGIEMVDRIRHDIEDLQHMASDED
jgi:hypothetical protein